MENNRTIRVMLVDDHETIRQGLSIFLQAFDDLLLVGEAINGNDAITLCDELKPDVILMDIMMPDLNGIEATRTIHRKHPDIQIIALTSYQDDEQLQQMLNAGAINYVFKDVSIIQLANTIREAVHQFS